MLYISTLFALFLFKLTLALEFGEEHSPLDEDTVGNLNSKERKDNKLPYVVEEREENAHQIFGALPTDCTSECNNHLFATLQSALEGSTNHVFQHFRGMCKNYENTMECLHGIRHCSTSKMYNTMTSGLRYMCVEQRNAIEAMLPCVNEVFPSIKPACERSCQTDRMVAGLTMKQMFQEDIKLLKMFDQHMGRLTTNEACRISQCMLKCYRLRMNVRCDGAAGSILTEGLIRPYSEVQKMGTLFAPLMAIIMPRQCSFLTDQKEMKEFRIDPDFDKHIHNKYVELQRIATTFSPQQLLQNPFQNLSMNAETSPLDNE